MAISAADQMLSIMLAELDAATSLLALLEQERQALIKSDFVTINEMNTQKQPFIVELERLGRNRDALLKMAGFPAGKQGMDAFVDNQDAATQSRLTDTLNHLKQAAKVCRSNNQINGGIVNVNRQFLVRALNILRGREAEASAYGPGGEYTSQVVRQPLLGRV